MGTFKVYAAGDMLTERHIREGGIVSPVKRDKGQGTRDKGPGTRDK